MLYVGLDVHSRQSSLCILNSAGGTVNQIQIKGSRAQVVDRLRQLDQPFSVCYEASCGYGHLYEALRPLAHHVAWTAIKKCPAFNTYFERIMGGKPERKKIAIVATAHRMIRVMGAMMRTGTAYDANYGVEDAAPARGDR